MVLRSEQIGWGKAQYSAGFTRGAREGTRSKLKLQFTEANGRFWQVFGDPGVPLGDGSERREARRFNMSLPMRVLQRQGHPPELRAQTRDVSYRGLYFLADASFEIGSAIEFVITLPRQVTRAEDVNIRCQGQIVRVEPGSNGRTGMAARIERYEFLHAAA